ncbi:hypothetical protein [Pseudomonas sp. SDO55104_S430]
MYEFTHGDMKVAFTVLSGEVVGSEKLSETRVTTTGGGRNADGDARPVRVSSESIINHEFWIRTPDGIEHDVKLRGVDVPLREGQQVSLFSAQRKDGKAPVPVLLQNHSAAKRWLVRDAAALNMELGLVDFKWSSLWIAFALLIGVGIASPGLGFIAFVVFIFYQCYQASKRKRLLFSDLNAFLEKLGTQKADRVQAQANPFESMLQASGIELSDTQVQSISLQFELPVEVQVSAPEQQAPAEAPSPVLDSNAVLRALSRKS